MTISERISRIQRLLVEDKDFLDWIEQRVKEYQGLDHSVLTDAQFADLENRKARHLAEESASYSWDEVKRELIEKYGLPS